MNGTLRILRSELSRLLGSWSLWAVGLAVGLVASIRALASVAAVLDTGAIESGGAWGPLVDGMRSGLTLTAFALLVTSARSLAGDHESGLLRVAVTRSVARPALVLGRLLLAPLPILGGLAVATLGAWLVARSQLDFGAFVEDGYELLGKEELWTEVRRSTLSTLPALVAIWSFGLLVSSFSRSAVGAVAGALVLLVTFDLVKDALGPELKFLVFASFAPTLADSSALSEAAGVVRGFSDSGFPEDLSHMALWLPWGQAMLITVVAMLVIHRRAL